MTVWQRTQRAAHALVTSKWWERASAACILVSFVASLVAAEMRPPDKSELKKAFDIVDDIFTGRKAPGDARPCFTEIRGEPAKYH